MTTNGNLELIQTNEEGEQTEISLPTHDWIWENFTSKSAAIRYLHLEVKAPIQVIARYLNLKYRHVYRVCSDADKATLNTHTCPVCRNRKN